MATSREPCDPRTLPGNSSGKHSLHDDIAQTSRKALKSHEDSLPQDLSSCTLERSVTPEIQDQVQDTQLASAEVTSCQLGHPEHHTSLDCRQHQCHTATSDPVRGHSSSRIPCRIREAQPYGLASPPEPVESVPIEPQAFVLCSSQTCRQWASSNLGTNQPPQVSFPPYAPPGHYPTDRVYTNPPMSVSLTEVQRCISLIDETTVHNLLAVAVVRHKDIHDMVETDYDRIQKERQERWNEDASVLSFVGKHTKVQKILYEEYDDFPTSKKLEIVHRAMVTINQTIVGISARVRPTSNWKTKFNAFLTLLWIGRGIVDGIGLLPNAIRAQMAFDSKLVEAIDDVYETMSKTEVLRDGARLFEALVDLNNDREYCFAGLDTTVDVFRDAMYPRSIGRD